MHAPPYPLRLLAVLVIVFAASPLVLHAADDPARVGVVDKVEHEAQIILGNSATTATVGTPVHTNDELRTGPAARLQVTFRDNTVLTLGEKASVVINRYVYDPGHGIGETVLETTRGAFRFASGRIKAMKQSTISVTTPVAEIGVRGTEFWGGPLAAKYGVLLLKGEVTVTNQAGSVTLAKPGQGTDILSSREAPGPVKPWSADKIARAVATVALH